MPLKISKMGQAVVVTETTKVKAKPKTKTTSGVVTQDKVWVDELVQIDGELKDLEVLGKIERRDELKNLLQSVAKELPADQEATLKGTVGEVTFSKCRKETSISDKEGLISALGQDTFNLLASVSLTDLKKYLSENEIAPLVASTNGSRTLKTVKCYDS